MLDYSKEADRYDASRGGEPRAAAAATAVLGLIPAEARTLLDVACGTGLVTRRLAARDGLRVTGVDAAHRMAEMAAGRVPGAVVLGDSRHLPFPDGAFDAVSTVWLLHLLSGPEEMSAVVGECARVLRPGGVYVPTVDKAVSHDVGSDIDIVLAPRAVVLGLAVGVWIGGFDLIYACQDVETDREVGVKSVPARFGIP
ncbi:methyltransferase domain-containing protein, partial [Streptomyces sp. G44]|uniref:class I SAM-dependent methyltransferase n=1 Tax=Streptomyces sp. G44 TaxID=2807632 RepID=UPI0019620576